MLINITGGPDLTLYEVNAASTIIREAADEDANIIFGAVIDESMHGEMRITVIATGFGKEGAAVAAAMANTAMPATPAAVHSTSGGRYTATDDEPRRSRCADLHSEESRLSDFKE